MIKKLSRTLNQITNRSHKKENLVMILSQAQGH